MMMIFYKFDQQQQSWLECGDDAVKLIWREVVVLEKNNMKMNYCDSSFKHVNTHDKLCNNFNSILVLKQLLQHEFRLATRIAIVFSQ